MISTSELVAGIPPYMFGLISQEILGRETGSAELIKALENNKRITLQLESLDDDLMELLETMSQLGGWAEWNLLMRIYRDNIDGLRTNLATLGRQGLLFQGGITGRDNAILLPALVKILQKRFVEKAPKKLKWSQSTMFTLWDHIIMLNLIASNKLRSRSGMEPFKRGWMLLEEQLAEFMDVKKVYWELVELKLLNSNHGTLEVVPGSGVDLALSGEVRYQIWCFFRSCQAYNGLEYRLCEELFSGVCSRRHLLRTISFYLLDKFADVKDVDAVCQELLQRWIDLGVILTSGDWLQMAEPVKDALISGQTTSDLVQYAEEVIIQPNMEILVPRDLDPVDHVSLGEIADLNRPDIASIYRITRESVQRAFSLGWDMDKISGFLDRISRHHLPDNVMQTVAGWALTRANARIMTGTFLFLEEEQISMPGLEEVVSGVYLVKDGYVDKVLAELQRKGVSVEGLDQEKEEGEVSWGRALPISLSQTRLEMTQPKDGVYPFGMVSQLPYGSRGLELFEQARKDSRPMIIFYPQRGYGEIQVKKITPVYIYSTAGVSYVEAFCEDSGEGEVFDISKVRALFNL